MRKDCRRVHWTASIFICEWDSWWWYFMVHFSTCSTDNISSIAEKNDSDKMENFFFDHSLLTSCHIPCLDEFFDKGIPDSVIWWREFFSTTTFEMVSHELTVCGLEESHSSIDLMSNIRAVRPIFSHLDDFLESSTGFSECDEDVFSIVLHKKIPYHMVWWWYEYFFKKQYKNYSFLFFRMMAYSDGTSGILIQRSICPPWPASFDSPFAGTVSWLASSDLGSFTRIGSAMIDSRL